MSEEKATVGSDNSPYLQWVDGIKNRDPESWKSLIKFHGGELRYEIEVSLVKRGLGRELIDDIEQETWVTALHAIHNFEWKSEELFFRWLRVISLNHVRKLKRQYERQVSIDDFENHDDSLELEQFYAKYGLYNQGVEDQVIWRERLIKIDSVLRQLKPQDSEIFLQWLMGEKPRELAVQYHKKPRTVSMFLMRTKQKIKNLLDDELKRDDYHD